jgi:hypothetical protein
MSQALAVVNKVANEHSCECAFVNKISRNRIIGSWGKWVILLFKLPNKSYTELCDFYCSTNTSERSSYSISFLTLSNSRFQSYQQCKTVHVLLTISTSSLRYCLFNPLPQCLLSCTYCWFGMVVSMLDILCQDSCAMNLFVQSGTYLLISMLLLTHTYTHIRDVSF